MGPVRRADEEIGPTTENTAAERRHQAKGRKRLRMETSTNDDDVQILEDHTDDVGRQQATAKVQKPAHEPFSTAPGPSKEGKKRGKTEDSDRGKEGTQTKGKGKTTALCWLLLLLLCFPEVC